MIILLIIINPAVIKSRRIGNVKFYSNSIIRIWYNSFVIIEILLRHHSAKGVIFFAVLTFLFAVHTLSYAIQINSISPKIAYLFFVISHSAVHVSPLFFFLFVIKYSQNYKFTPLNICFYSAIPFFSVAFLISNQYHHLMYSDISFNTENVFVQIITKPSYWYWIQQTYALSLNVIAISILFNRFIHAKGIVKKQMTMIIFGVTVPLICHILFHPNMLNLLKLNIIPMPFAFLLSGIMVYYGFHKFRLFQFEPVARDILFEKMSEGIIVIDSNGLIIVINNNALLIWEVPHNC
ncbi:MAG: histidine kinase N-terminal 7TM domain-containing protein, partial [Candidatus Cloacimonetes bacterium]|nr:histidine kinase N-terminal 7TM domain-containing protein [Candidatus Cloacimonadota bacterium]